VIELQDFLRAAQRRLWLARFAMTLDLALVIANAVALLGVLWKLLLGALALAPLAAAVAGPCLVALLWTGRRRPTLETAARWADERCRAQGVFATGLEFLLQARRRGSPAALAALRVQIGRALPAAAAQVAAERPPGTLRIALLTGSCVALCGLGLRIPAGRADLQAAVSPARVRAAAELAPAPSEDVPRAAEQLRTALKESATATAAPARPAGDEDAGVRRGAALRSAPVSSASAHPEHSALGESTGDGGGREAGSSAAPASAGVAAGATARFRAAFRDLATVRNPDGTARAGHESLELEGGARWSEAAAFDARQRAQAPEALRAAAPREQPRAVESAAAREMLARYAALTAASR
jgi:hypothetical protein